ncbi:hypothetical protein PCANB_001764 [Pneumocystis canis]|nr:hypothetical protein PCK1_002010 [Pneumocystis canis]KAG5440195.1 hypothetical protein PCANB_001764 [Pneumocystis canis]
MELNELRFAALLSQKKNSQSSTNISKDFNLSKKTFNNEQNIDEKEEGEISDDQRLDKNNVSVDIAGKSFLKKKGYMNKMSYKKYSRIRDNNTIFYPHLYPPILSQNSPNIKLEGKLALQFLSSQGISFEYLAHLGINKDFLRKIFVEAGLTLPESENSQKNDNFKEKSDLNTNVEDGDKKSPKIIFEKSQNIDIVDHTNKSVDVLNTDQEFSKKQSQYMDSDTFLQNIRDSIIDKKIKNLENIEKNASVSHKRKHASTLNSDNKNISITRRKFGSESAASVVIEFSDDDNEENSDNSNNTDNKPKKILKSENMQRDAIEELKQKEEEIKHMMKIIAKLESSKKKKIAPMEKDVSYVSTSNVTSIDEENSSSFEMIQEKKKASKNSNCETNKAMLHEKEQELQNNLDKINMQLFQKELMVQKLKNKLVDAELLLQKSFQMKSDIEMQLKNVKEALDSVEKCEGNIEDLPMKNLVNSYSISEKLSVTTDSKNEIFISSNSILLTSNQNDCEKIENSNFSNDKDKNRNIETSESLEKIMTTSISHNETNESLENKKNIVEIKKDNDKFNILTDIHELSQAFKSHKEEVSTSIKPVIDSQKNLIINTQESENNIIDNKSDFNFYKQYSSPLRIFHAFRYHPYFLSWVKGGFRSRTYSTRSDPNKKICFFETAGGVCNDDSCKFLHFKDIGQTDDQFLIEISLSPVGETEEEQKNYRIGLRTIIQSIRTTCLFDITKAAQSIIDYRRKFVKDKSRVIPF